LTPAPPEISHLSLHDALPIWDLNPDDSNTFPGDKTPDNGVFPFWLDDFDVAFDGQDRFLLAAAVGERNLFSDSNSIVVSSFIAADRKSTRLNSSHVKISYAVF